MSMKLSSRVVWVDSCGDDNSIDVVDNEAEADEYESYVVLCRWC